ncbi:MAG: YqhA family protein [Acetobacteraceae bacterium]
MALSLVDFAPAGNLPVVMALAGYSGFIARIMGIPVSENVSQMGTFDLASIKLKLVAAIVGISSIRLPESFIYPAQVPGRVIFWQVVIQIVIVLSGLLLALMDRVSGSNDETGDQRRNGDAAPSQ